MDTAWRIVDCSSLAGELSSGRGSVSVHTDGRESTKIAVADISVLLIGTHVVMSASVLHRLLKADIVVMFCDWRGVPEGAAYPWHEHTRIGARQLAQARLSQPRRKNAWGRIVKAKVLGQSVVLSRADDQAASSLRELAKKVRSGDPENIEAHAARLYWSRIFRDGQGFLRNPSADDNRNNCLNYGYGVLRAYGVRAVVSAGLNPTLGIFHRGRSNAFNLVDDLIESFRPAVDDAVLSLKPSDSLEDRTVKQRLVTAVQQSFDPTGASLPTVLERLAQHLGQYCEGDRTRLNVPSWTGPGRVDDGG